MATQRPRLRCETGEAVAYRNAVSLGSGERTHEWPNGIVKARRQLVERIDQPPTPGGLAVRPAKLLGDGSVEAMP